MNSTERNEVLGQKEKARVPKMTSVNLDPAKPRGKQTVVLSYLS